MNYEFFYRWQLVRILEKIFLLEFIFSCMDGSDKKIAWTGVLISTITFIFKVRQDEL